MRVGAAPDPTRARGAIYTPPWLVARVVHRVLEPFTQGADPEAIFALKILDPACGAAAFLLGVYDHLSAALLAWARALPGEEVGGGAWVTEGKAGLRLTAQASLRIIATLHGVEIDPEAVTAARAALARRHQAMVEVALEVNPPDPRLDAALARAIRQGNALLGAEVPSKGCFHAVVGNPPFVEAKRYRAWLPELHSYLKDAEGFLTVHRGKADLAIPFLEMSVKSLRPGGRLGFVIQSRFFKADYGAPMRRWLSAHRLLEEIEDFGDLQIFPGCTTYAAVLFLQANSPSFTYRSYDDLAAARAGRPHCSLKVKSEALAESGDAPWSFGASELFELHAALVRRHGTLGAQEGVTIGVGLQTLYGKLYRIHPVEVTAQLVRGVNGLGVEVVLERAALRPICRNRGFYPFRARHADAWVVFPYDVEAGVARELHWPEFARRFPRTASYLERHRALLQSAVSAPGGPGRWHLYTRPQNLVAQARPKVLFPMTIEDVAAAVDVRGEVYQDNVNVNGLIVKGDAVDLVAVAAVFNSTLFNALARLKAGLNGKGWRKLNRQFASLVPFPMAALEKACGGMGDHLARLGARIEVEQARLVEIAGEERPPVRAGLTAIWAELDDAVETLYGLTTAQREMMRRYPRKADRVEWALRAGGSAPTVVSRGCRRRS